MLTTAFGFFSKKEVDDDSEDISENQIRRINMSRSKNKFMLYPDSSFRSIIDGISFILMLIISLYIPFVIAFSIETTN